MPGRLTGISGFDANQGVPAGAQSANDAANALLPGAGVLTGVDPSDLPGAGIVSGVVGGVQSVGDFLAFIASPNTLIRAAEAIAGGVLIIGGLFLLGAKTDTGQTIIKTAGAATGAAAKGAAL